MKRLLPLAILLVASSATAQSFRWTGLNAEPDAGAKASLLPDGPWLTGELDKRAAVAVQDAAPTRPQILEYAQGLKLLLHLDPTTLGTFTLAGATLAPTEAAATTQIGPKTPGMMLRAGIRIDEQSPAADGLTKVRLGWTWNGGSLEIRGFVLTAKLGKIYESRYVAMPAMYPNVTLPGNFTLADAPGGTAFVVSTNADRVAAMVLEKKGKHTLVRVSQGAVGWVASNKVKPIPKAKRSGDADGVEGGEEGGVMGGVIGGVTLEAGTKVYSAIDGRVVGEADDWFTLAPTKVVKTWSRFTVKTRFGMVEVWAQPGTPRPASPPSPPPPPPPAPPQNVPPTLLEGNRISGTKAIVPDDATKKEIERSGKDAIVGSFKLCLDTTGTVTSVTMLKSTRFPSYDATLQAGMRAWTYRPFEVNGRAVPVCTAVTFIYSAKPRTP